MKKLAVFMKFYSLKIINHKNNFESTAIKELSYNKIIFILHKNVLDSPVSLLIFVWSFVKATVSGFQPAFL
jgi:hypothetical protein